MISAHPPVFYDIIPALFWGAALFFSLFWQADYELQFMAAALGSLVLAAALALGTGRGRIPDWPPHVSAVTCAGLLFWFWMLITVLFSSVPHASAMAFFLFSALPLSVMAAAACSSGFQVRLKFFLAGAGTVLAVLALYALVQYFFYPDMLYAGRVHRPLANPNALAAFLAMGFLIALAVLGQVKNGKSSILLAAFAVLLLCALLTAGSRSVLILLALCTFIFLVTARKSYARKLWHLVGILLAGILFFASMQNLPQDGASRYKLGRSLTKTVTDTGQALSSRPLLWYSAFEMAADHPVTGTGPGTFFLYYPAYRNPADLSAGLMAHNDPLQFAVETGWAGFVLYYLFFLLFAGRSVRAFRQAEQKEDRLVIAACGAVTLLIVAHSHVSFDFYVLPILTLLGAVLGVWLVRTGQIPEAKNTAHKAVFSLPGFTAVFFLATLFLYFFAQFALSEYYVRQAKTMSEKKDLKHFSGLVNRAGRYGFGLNDKPYVLAAGVPAGIIEYSPHLPEDERQRLYAEASDLLTRALSVNPRQVTALYRRALLEKSMGHTAQSQAALEKALTLNPYYLPVRTELLAFYAENDQIKAAQALIREALGWHFPGQDPRPYYMSAAAILLETGDVETRTEILEEMRAYSRRHQKWPARPQAGGQLKGEQEL